MGSSSSSFTSSSPSFSSSSSYSDEELVSCRHSPFTTPPTETVEKRVLTLLNRQPIKIKDLLKSNELLHQRTADERLKLRVGGILPALLSLIYQFSSLKTTDEDLMASRRDSGIHDSSIVFGRKGSHAAPSSAGSCRGDSNKGVGYGVGSTKSKWDVERVIEMRMQGEQKLTVLLRALINLLDVKEADCDEIPPLDDIVVEELAEKSCLFQLLAHYLNNDSVFDVSQHISLYQALIELLEIMVGSQEMLVHLSNPAVECSPHKPILTELLPRFQLALSAYPSTVGRNHSSNDLNFMHFIERVSQLSGEVHKRAGHLEGLMRKGSIDAANIESCDQSTKDMHLNSIYTELLESYQMKAQKLLNDVGKPIYGYTFKRELRGVNPESASNRDRTRRIAKELASMHNALPLNASNSIFVCMEETRCDILKVLVSGPDDTPYQNGLFEFDVWFPQSYPHAPPKCFFLTTGAGTIRFNPNLYSDGKICLSILGTWEGRPEEKWNSLCSLLQVLISIQGLIFVKKPYYNEPGYEKLQGTVKGEENARKYNLHIENATLIYSILRQFEDPPPYFSDVIKRHFWAKRELVIAQAELWLRNAAKEIQQNSNDPQTDADGSTMDGMLTNACLYRREVRRLIEVFRRMPSPL